jgi:diaminohydroxyphosphoribosylaminopyrimidine deaminase/5-amino-6-(5-phosphoribosylamino)uracil reductase
VLADNCALTVRDDTFTHERLPEPGRRAIRVVADSRLQTPATAAVLAGDQPSLLLHARDAAIPSALAALPRLGLATAQGRLVPQEIVASLAARECNEILLESGPTLAGALLRSGLADELIVYLAPRLLGNRARPLLDLPIDSMADALDLRLVDRRQIGDDQRFIYKPAQAE